MNNLFRLILKIVSADPWKIQGYCRLLEQESAFSLSEGFDMVINKIVMLIVVVSFMQNWD